MTKFGRRNFIKTGILSALSLPLYSFTSANKSNINNYKNASVKFTRDGLDLNPAEYSALLAKLTSEKNIIADNYSRGGIVEELENKMANLLGMESAVFMPTGTLANQIAIRKLAGNNKKVIVQAESHIYNDSGDCAQNLSSLNLIPLAKGKTNFTLKDVKEAVLRAKNGRVKTNVGVIVIESPVRRTDNAMFDYEEMKKISEFARQNNIKMHLDGARIFNAVAHSGIPANEYTKLFDTVYVSMYKDFNAASGAILAGTSDFCKDLYHTRRMFGGGSPQVWPFAVVALHYSDTFLPEYNKAMKQFDKFEQLISKESKLRIEKITNGTNVFKFYVETKDIELFRKRLLDEGIILPRASSENMFKLKINTTLNEITPKLLVEKFKNSI